MNLGTYNLGTPTEYAVTTIDEKDTALRAGWNARGQREILYMGVGATAPPSHGQDRKQSPRSLGGL